MIPVSKIGWSHYTHYEGPWFGGTQRMPKVEPSDPLNRKIIQVITSTEGGAFDAINMYDRMIMSVGLIQWGDAGQMAVTDMLGEVAERSRAVASPVIDYAAQKGFSFVKLGSKWRFRYANGEVVDTIKEQQDLYLAGCSGDKGTWDEGQKLWARGFAAAMASVFQQDVAKEVQMNFTVDRLGWFIPKQAKQILFEADADKKNPIVQAAQAIYLSFAINLPVVANAQLQKVDHTQGKWTVDWLTRVLKQLTFGPKIAIYPHRYNALRPHVERLWGVDLPDLAKDLSIFRSDLLADAHDSVERVAGIDMTLMDPVSIQEALIFLGFDLGQAGADGVFGRMTKTAIVSFQQMHMLQADGIIGKNTRAALRKAVLKKAA